MQMHQAPPKSKRRKKGEHKEQPFVGGQMLVLTEEQVPQSTMDRRAWKKAHNMGKQSIAPDEIQDPHTRWRNRTFNTEHVKDLKESFQQHQKMNCHGLKLVLIKRTLAQVRAMDDEKKVAARQKGSYGLYDSSPRSPSPRCYPAQANISSRPQMGRIQKGRP